MRARTLLLIGAVLLVVLATVFLAVPEPGLRPAAGRAAWPAVSWTSPYNLSNSSDPQYVNTQRVHAKWGPDSYLHAAWMEGKDGSYGAVYTRGLGTVWQYWAFISGMRNPAYAHPDLALDSQNNVHAVWTADPEAPYGIYYAVQSGGIWSTPLRLTIAPVPQSSSFYPAIAVDSQNRIWVAWETGVSESDSDIWVRSKPAGGEWSAPQRIASSTKQDINVRIAIGKDDSVHAVWRSNQAGNYDIFYARYDGSSWSVPVNVSATGGQSYYPDVDADGAGNVFVVWTDEIDGTNGFDILARRYDGAAWQPVQRASNRLKALYPTLDAEGCNLYVAWADYLDNPNGRPDAFFAYSTDCGASWSGGENVSRNGTFSTYPDVAAGPYGVANVFWQDTAPGQIDIFFSQGTVVSITPTPTTPPTPSPVPTFTPTPILTPQIYVPFLARGWDVTPAPTRTPTYTPTPTRTPTNTPTPTLPPTAAFTTSAPVCDGVAVAFTNTSDLGVPPANQFLWAFGDGITTTVENPTHAYALPGDYVATFELCNTAGCDAVTGTVQVLPLPAAGFTLTTELLTITLTNTSVGATSYLWDMGDGVTSTLPNPVHTYATSGTYTITLDAAGECGADQFTATVTVSTLPTAGFFSNTPVCLGEPSVFTNTSSGAYSYTWDFGDGDLSTKLHPIHLYAAAGSYTVTLTACNGMGCDAAVGAVEVLPLPTAGFTFTANLLTVTFTNSSSNTASYLWSFGDGFTSTLQNPVHTYTTSGTYTVTLWATGACGTVVTTAAVTVSTSPQALVVVFPAGYPCKGPGSDQPIRALAYVTDNGGIPVSDATVTVMIGAENWALAPLSGSPGYYGDGATCWTSPTLYSSDQDVTIIASRSGYIGNSATSNTSVTPGCAVCP